MEDRRELHSSRSPYPPHDPEGSIPYLDGGSPRTAFKSLPPPISWLCRAQPHTLMEGRREPHSSLSPTHLMILQGSAPYLDGGSPRTAFNTLPHPPHDPEGFNPYLDGGSPGTAFKSLPHPPHDPAGFSSYLDGGSPRTAIDGRPT